MHLDDGARPTSELDDFADRAELRGRYEMLLQEMRVVIPGVQVLLAFLLTAPFAPGFVRLDAFGRGLFGVALMSALTAVIVLLFPAVVHRVGVRTARADRVQWGARCLVAGFAMLAISLTSAVWCVSRFAFGSSTMVWIPAVAAALFIGCWGVPPRLIIRSRG